MSLLREYIRESILAEAPLKSMEDVKTVGDLRKLIQHASAKKKGKTGAKGLAGTALDIVVDEIQALIPGFATVKNLAMAAKNTYKLDDEAKSGTALDVMNVDDDISKIIDDPIENAFMKVFTQKLEKFPDDTPLRDMDVTAALTKWIAAKFNNAQVAKPKNESIVRELVRELLSEQNVQATGMCFPFAYQKAEEWFEAHFTKGVPGRAPKKHPDLNNKGKFKVVHGTVTDKWKSPPKPVVHGWVEMGDLVFDAQTSATKPNGIEKEVYYDMYQPEVFGEFTAEEAVVNCVMKGGEGPWDDELYAMMQKRDAWLKEEVAADDITYDRRGRPGATDGTKAFMSEYRTLSKQNPIGMPGDRYWYMGEIDEKYCLVITNMSIDPYVGNTVDFNNIQTVPPDVCEGQGFASKIMKKITDLADKHKVSLSLEAVPFGQKSVTEENLVAWYKRAGFKEDPEYSEVLVRNPQ